MEVLCRKNIRNLCKANTVCGYARSDDAAIDCYKLRPSAEKASKRMAEGVEMQVASVDANRATVSHRFTGAATR